MIFPKEVSIQKINEGIHDLDESLDSIIQNKQIYPTFIEGHRGIDYQPENTIISFQAAIELGCDSIELDVWLTKDGIPVVIHGGQFGEIEHYTNGQGIVNNLSLNELKEFRVKNSNEEIPTLRQVFENFKNIIFINIELKDFKIKETITSVWELIEEFQMQDQICISSFNHEYISEIRKMNLDLEIGILFDRDQIFSLDSYSGLDFKHKCTVNLHYSCVTEELVKEVRKQGLGLHVWFCKNPDNYENQIVKEDEDAFLKLLLLEVDVICTNYADKAIKIRENFKTILV